MKKLQIVRDNKGLVVGTFELSEEADVVMELELEEGFEVEESTVLHQELFDLNEFYKKRRIKR